MDVGSVLAETYEITRLLGKGGMGAVWEARHLRLDGKKVAIKVLHPDVARDAEAVTRFRREAQIASRLGHPNIVQVHDFNTLADGTAYLVLELLEGESLDARLQRGPLSLEQSMPIVRQIGSALHAAHSEGIIHRDLKPHNVFLCPTEAGGYVSELVKVLDFGISKIRGSNTVETQTSAILGTPQYMAPEQAMGQHSAVDARTDVFAFGVMIYEMLAGQPPFTGQAIPEVMFKVVYADPPDLGTRVATLPRPVVEAVHRALAKQQEDRFDSVSALIEAFTGTPLTTLRGAPAGAVGAVAPIAARMPAPSQARAGGEDAFAATMAPGAIPGAAGAAPGISVSQAALDATVAPGAALDATMPPGAAPAGATPAARVTAAEALAATMPPGVSGNRPAGIHTDPSLPAAVAQSLPHGTADRLAPHPLDVVRPPAVEPAPGLPGHAQMARRPVLPYVLGLGSLLIATSAILLVLFRNDPPPPPPAGGQGSHAATAPGHDGPDERGPRGPDGHGPNGHRPPPPGSDGPHGPHGHRPPPPPGLDDPHGHRPPPEQHRAPTDGADEPGPGNTAGSDRPARPGGRKHPTPDAPPEDDAAPESVRQELKEAASLLQQNNVDEAIRVARRTLGAKPTVAARILLTRAYCTKRDLGNARAHIQHVPRRRRPPLHRFCDGFGIDLR